MFTWWRGESSGDARRDQDHDGPETPAPVFAARAIKSAIFGTPKLYDARDSESRALDDSPSKRPKSELFGAAAASPAKPGILLTPGAGASRRKTVSFGESVADREQSGSKTGLPDDFPGKFPSPWVADAESHPRKTALTRTLEDARTTTRRAEKQTAAGDLAQASKTTKKLDDDEDYTYDLNYPRSQSGQYWKAEFQRYHSDAQEEMFSLVRYKQLAKAYAKKKDAEAYELGEKLLAAEQKIQVLERKLADGASHTEAARQKSRADGYQKQVEELQDVIQSLQPGQDIDGTSDVVRKDLQNLRLNLSTAEKKSARLQDENAKLAEELSRLKKDLARSERRREEADGRLQKRDASIKSLQTDHQSLKEMARSQRRDTEQSLKRRHDQIMALRKELSDLRKQVTSDKVDAVDVHDDAITLDSPRKWDTQIGVLESRLDVNFRNAIDDEPSQPNLRYTPRRADSDTSDNARVLDKEMMDALTPKAGRVKKIPSPFKPNSKLRKSPGADVARQHEQLDAPSPGGLRESRRWQSADDIFGTGRRAASPTRSPSRSPAKHRSPSRPSPPHEARMRTEARPLVSRPRLYNGGSGRPKTTLDPERAAAAMARIQQRNADKKRRELAESLEHNKENLGG